jgi:DNA polymerase-3 subunit gamma/tau
MSTLYRDYRPQNFSDVLGQNHVKVSLQNEVSAGRPANAYLFCGPRAVGKTTLARILAKALNCENRKEGEYEPCNACVSCRSITAGQNLDIVEIDAASNTGVDNVRENIIAFSRLNPSQAKFKVFIIDEVHMLSISAFNALLKIIEEPPAYVVFILCTTEIQKVPGTIISRCERFDFKRISVKEIVRKLSYISNQEKVVIAPEVLEAVARRSGGHLRDAESLLGQIFSLGDKEISSEQAELIIPHYNSSEAISLIECLAKKEAAKAITLINNLVDSGISVKIFTTETIGLLRQIMLAKMNPELVDSLGLDLGEHLEKRLAQAAELLNWDQIISFSRRLLEAANDSKSPLIPQLPLELAVAELCLGSYHPNLSQASPALSRTLPPASPKIGSSSPRPADTKPSPAAKSGTVRLSLEQIMAKWPEFLVRIKKHNHSLSFILQNCEPREIKDGRLCFAFKYKFHQDRINDPNIRSIVDDTLAEVFAPGLSFESLIDENMSISHEDKSGETAATEAAPSSAEPSTLAASEKQPAGGLMSDLLKTFGGEIIN